jgi:uncharacterized damage-inducible protein DinB
MNTISILADLFHHMHWADALIWNSVLKNSFAATDQTIRKSLHHIHLCQHAWLRIWLGQKVDAHEGESFDLTGLARWARQYHEGAARYIASVEEPDMDVEVAVPGLGEEMTQPHLWETLLQITAHSTYHRGQVSARLREVGGEPPQTDFITWVVLRRPKAEWPDTTGS